MKKVALAAIAGALALSACDKTPNDDTPPAGTATGDADTTVVMPGPGATATTVVTTPAASTTATATTSGDQVSIGPNGVTADVGDGDTRVRVDTNDAAVSIKKK